MKQITVSVTATACFPYSYDIPMNFMPNKTGNKIAVPLGDTIE